VSTYDGRLKTSDLPGAPQVVAGGGAADAVSVSVPVYACGAALRNGQTTIWYVPAAGLEIETVSLAPNEPESCDTELPSGRTIVMIRSAGPLYVTEAAASTDTWSYVPAGTASATSCGSAPIAAPLQSLPALAPGSAVPVQVTVTVWPAAVGTVTWSSALTIGTIPAMTAIAAAMTNIRRGVMALPPWARTLGSDRDTTLRGYAGNSSMCGLSRA